MPAIEPYHTFAALFGYLLGSMPFGLVLTRMAGLGDIRKIGSGNIGATNVLRTGSKSLAFLTLTGDTGKGAAAAIVTTHFWSVETGLIAGFMAVLGHNFPIWLKFKGGKGVATYIGFLLQNSKTLFLILDFLKTPLLASPSLKVPTKRCFESITKQHL